MGGQAFTTSTPGTPALHVPRMPPSLYEELRNQCHNALITLYATIVTPAEAPGKADYGDVDFLVAVDVGCESPRREEVARVLGAQRAIGVCGLWSFAVPWPEEAIGLGGEGESGAPYAQVDVHVCRGEQLQWKAFKHSYGDLWQILSNFIRPCGLTANDKGLYVRVEEIEPSNRKESMIFLTSSPMQCLAFLGLDVGAYAAGFASEDALFAWVRGCRCFRNDGDRGREENANDRQRLRKRFMYRRFMVEWAAQQSKSHAEDAVLVASTSANGKSDASPPTRRMILEEALDRSGRHTEYDEKIEAHRQSEREHQFWDRARAVLQAAGVQGDRLNRTTRAFARWVRFEGGVPVVRGVEEMNAEEQPAWTKECGIGESEALAWVERRWLDVTALEKARIRSSKVARDSEAVGND